MNRIVTLLLVAALSLAVVASGVAIVLLSSAGADQPSAEPESADALFRQLVAAKDWRERQKAAAALAKVGRPALPRLLQGSQHKDGNVREECLRILTDHFADDPAAFAAIVGGLNDPSGGIAYECALFLGKSGNKAAVQPLRKMLTHRDEWTRYAAAKSLAQLGEKDVLVTLYFGLESDRYMIRMMSNAGVKALTGKDLNDFKYNYSEGALVSGGAEYRTLLRPIYDAELKASRFQAVANFCRWLEKEKPELYAILAPKTKAERLRTKAP